MTEEEARFVQKPWASTFDLCGKELVATAACLLTEIGCSGGFFYTLYTMFPQGPIKVGSLAGCAAGFIAARVLRKALVRRADRKLGL